MVGLEVPASFMIWKNIFIYNQQKRKEEDKILEKL
jgi:hypothetical protein